MEIEKSELENIVKRRCVILDKITLLEKGIKILDPKRFMWTQTKQNYNKHVEWMENWKDIVEKKVWASRAGLVPLFLLD